MRTGKLKKLLIFILLFSFFFISNKKVEAGLLADIGISSSDSKPLHETTQTIDFKLATTQKLKTIEITYKKSTTDQVLPANLSVIGQNGPILGLAATWAYDFTQASSGIAQLVNSESDPTELSSGTDITFSLYIKNPELGDCIQKEMKDTCTMTIQTYDETNSMVDVGNQTFDIQEDPELAFSIAGVAADTVTNGISTDIPTDYDEINFSHMDLIAPKFAAQKLSVKSNTPNGYQVKMKLDGYLEGLQPQYKIDPFQPEDVSWNAPGTWTTPTGACDERGCTDTGWIGANTSDHRVDDAIDPIGHNDYHWTNGAGKFGPVSSARHIVMASPGRDGGTSIYVTYGLEVNQNQPPDSYAGTLVYDLIATY